jgi:hypothetical protein
MLTLTRLVHAAFFSCVVDLDVLLNATRSEAGKTFQVAFVNRFTSVEMTG